MMFDFRGGWGGSKMTPKISDVREEGGFKNDPKQLDVIYGCSLKLSWYYKWIIKKHQKFSFYHCISCRLLPRKHIFLPATIEIIFLGHSRREILVLHSWVLGVDNLAKWQKNMQQLKHFGRLFGHKSTDS